MTHTLRGFMVRSAALGLIVWCAGIHEGAAQSHPSMEMPGNEVGATALTGKVVETMNSGGYTYVLVDDGTKKTWAAGPPSTVAVGDQVIVANGMPMHDFTSKTLGRTFDVIYFAPGIQVVGAKLLDHMAAVHGMASNGSAAAAPAAAVDLSNIKKADGGKTIAELFANKAALAGKPVIVRGRVVKFTPAVMGKNWVHVRDGTGDPGTNDLAVSTGATAAVGDLVLVRGTLGTDRDLGAGYRYDIIIEDAALAVE